MVFYRRAPGTPRYLAILAGAFNPPTAAHLALAEAALERANEVLFALPEVFPHKDFEGAGFGQRIAMLLAATAREPRFSVASPRRGLFIEIARECREAYGPEVRLAFLCGSDAAARIVEWDYGELGAFLKMLDEFELWVADRPHPYEPPPEMRHAISRIRLGSEWREISSTAVREKIARVEAWESLVPESIREMVRKTYS